MKKKKILIFGMCGAMLAGALIGLKSYKMAPTKSNASCNHVGYHYAANDPTCTAGGNKEFWACCECHSQFLEKPDVGTFTDKAFSGVLESTHIAYAAPEHAFGENGNCLYCSSPMATLEGLEAGDHNKRMTLSDMNEAVPYNIKDLGRGHLFPVYSIGNNNGMELYFNFDHGVEGDSWLYFYLGNDIGEDGLIVRLNSGRTDRYTYSYLRTNASGACEKLNNDFAHCQLLFKTSEAMPVGGQLVKVTMTLVDKATETYHFDMDLSSNGGLSWAPKWYSTEGGEAFTGLDYTFGAGYFDGNAHSYLRFSNGGSTTVVLRDGAFATQKVSYANEEGTVFGHEEYEIGDPVKLPKMKATGKVFLGWFDQHGVKYTAGALARSGDAKLVARFETVQNLMLQPSDAGFNTKNGNAVTFTTESANENRNVFPQLAADTTRVDIYMMISYEKAATGQDGYFSVAFPYDFIDAKSRVNLRIANKVDQPKLDGYIYGGSLGSAGATGTSYSDTNYEMNGSNMMVHMTAESTDSINYHYTFKITNLGNGYTTTIQRDVTFADNCYTFSTQNRTALCFSKQFVGGSYTVSDIF